MSMELHTDLLGEHLTICTLQGLAIDLTTGVISNAGDAVEFAARVLSLGHNLQIIADDIRPVNETGINMVPHSSGRGLRVQVLQDYDEAQVESINLLVNATASHRFLMGWTEGATVKTCYATLMEWTGGVENRGANPATLTFAPMKPRNGAQFTSVPAS